MVHGFAPLRCFRHERFLSLSYQVEYSVCAGIARNGCNWVCYWFMQRIDTLQITPDILSLIARIDEFKGAWRALGALAPDRLAALRRVATIESIASSTRIEGSKLSDREFASLQLSSDSISFQSSMPVRYNARTLTRKTHKKRVERRTTMKLEVLGCAGGEGINHRATAFLINDHLLLDAGSVANVLTLEQQVQLRYALISHAHLDHIKDLGFVVDNTFALRQWPLGVYAEASVIAALKQHFFNWTIWPDFMGLSNESGPVLEMHCIDGRVELDGLVIESIEVNHPGRAYGFVIEDRAADCSIVVTGDTAETKDIWLKARSLANLRAIFVDTAFPDHMAELARVSGHFTPSGLMRQLEQCQLLDEVVYCYHLKPAYHESVVNDIQSIGRPNIRVLQQGQMFNWS